METTGCQQQLLKKGYSSKWPNRHLALTCLLVAVGTPFAYGYQLLITNPAQMAFMNFVNQSYFEHNQEALTFVQLEELWGLIISLFFWGCTVGSFFIRTAADKLGRRNGLQAANIIQLIALSMSISSYFMEDYRVYAASRFILGLGIGLALGVGPIFITECSPKSCRGLTSLATGVMLQIGIVVGSIVAMPLLMGTGESWWKMYALEMILLMVVVVALPFMKESPSHLLAHGHAEKAEQSLGFYHGAEVAHVALKELEHELQTSGNSMGLLAVWRQPKARRGILVGGCVMVAMAMSGIAAINAFAVEILLSAGLSKFQASIGNVFICLTTVVGTGLSSMLVDRKGRRKLLLATFAIIAVLNAGIAGSMYAFKEYRQSWLGYCLLMFIALFNLVFATGPGPLSIFITGELVPHSARGASCTWVVVAMGATRSLLIASYMPIKFAIGQSLAYFLLFFPPVVVAVAVLYFYLPETKGKTAHEVHEAIQHLPRLRKPKENNLLVDGSL